MTSTTMFNLPGWDILEAAQRAGAVIDVEVWRFTIRSPVTPPAAPASADAAPAADTDGPPADGADATDDTENDDFAHPGPGKPMAVHRRSAGRPDMYDWAAIMTYVDGLVSAGGAPGKMADLARMVTAWCEAQGWRYIPSERRLVERLGLYKAAKAGGVAATA